MKAGIISHAPTVTTGFGVTCRQLALALIKSGHEVVCFGINESQQTLDRELPACRIWPVGNGDIDKYLEMFLKIEALDVLFINFDITFAHRWYRTARDMGWKGKTVIYFVADGVPIAKKYLSILHDVDVKITATHTVSHYLSSIGFDDVLVSPYGVDRTIFHPLPSRSALRSQAGIDDKFVVGVFGRNNTRKQHPRVMMALSQLRQSGLAENIIVYMHCQPHFENVKWSVDGWNLSEIARNLHIEDVVYFPSDDFLQDNGPPYLTNDNVPDTINRHSNASDDYNKHVHIPAHYGYVERMACCDLVVNVAYCGGFELAIIEAQACGVPVAVTNDRGIMAEVAGDGAILLDPSDIGIERSGAQQFFVSAQTIAETILSVQGNRALQAELRAKGPANAAKYSWEPFHQCISNVARSL